jgi:tRNA 2-thiouridine synthesizing protein B
MADVFILTKPPRATRSELCFKLMERSENAKLYLVGDGVYHLLSMSALHITTEEIMACGEDILARGLPINDDIVIPDNFYGQLVKDMMENSEKVYIF